MQFATFMRFISSFTGSRMSVSRLFALTSASRTGLRRVTTSACRLNEEVNEQLFSSPQEGEQHRVRRRVG